MAVDVRVNAVTTSVNVIDRFAPEVLDALVSAVKLRLADDERIAAERHRDVAVAAPREYGRAG
jgi:hypothetical protein